MRRSSPVHSRRLRLESLEGRRLLATFTVTSLVDEADGNFSAGQFSLREAIGETFNSPGADTIKFAANVRGTITLQNTSLSLVGDVTIDGPGAGKLTISGNDAVRIFDISGPGNTVVLKGLTLAEGHGGLSAPGAAINAFQTDLTIDECLLTGNDALDNGGAISYNGPGNLTILNSTLANNTASRNGGAVSTVISTNFRSVNSTYSGNTAQEAGGALNLFGGTATLVNCTITQNRADSDDFDEFDQHKGGGINVLATTTMNNSVIVGNLAGALTPSPSDIENGTVEASSSHNIIGNAATAGGIVHGTNSNIVGNNGVGTLSTTSVLTSALANNGGPTPTHNLVSTGPAVDSGSNALALDILGNPLVRDQRGAQRRIDADGNGSVLVDRGAVEFGKRPVMTLLGTAPTFVENGVPVAINADATVSDNDSPNFNLGRLTVTITANATSSDRLAIRSEGAIATTPDNKVTFNGVIIGNFTPGVGTGSLVVRLNNEATALRVAALLKNITFSTLGDNPSPLNRTVAFVLSDNTRIESISRNRAVKVQAVDDPTVLVRGNAPAASYVLNSTTNVRIAPNAKVQDPDAVALIGKRLVIQVSNGIDAGNRLFIGGDGFTVNASNELLFNGEKIGIRDSNGQGTNSLAITFTENLETSVLQDLLRAVRFRTANSVSAATRTIQFRFGTGDVPPLAFTRTVNVTTP